MSDACSSILDVPKVKSIPLKGRSKASQGDILSPGHLLVELTEASHLLAD